MNEKFSTKPLLLVLTSTYPRWPGDHEPRFVHELCKRMTSAFRVVVVAPSAPGAPSSEMMDGLEVVRFRYAPNRFEVLVNDGGILTNLRRSPWKFLLLFSFLIGQFIKSRQLLRAIQPNCIHSHWLIPQGLIVWGLSLLRTLPPVLMTSHGTDLLGLQGRVSKKLKRLILKRAALVSVVSPEMLGCLAELGVGENRCRVQPMGVDLEVRFKETRETERRNNQLLFVGRLIKDKGVDTLLDALPAVVEKHPGIKLLIIGHGPARPELERQASSLKLDSIVDFLGPVSNDNLPTHYSSSCLFVGPFIREGLGLVTIEAIGCGCPVLVSDIPATRDLDALKFRARDTGDLADRINEFLRLDEQSRKDIAGRQRAGIDRFDWSAVGNAYQQMLTGLLESQRKSVHAHVKR